MKRAEYDLAIIGSGFGGSLLSLIARRLGRSVVLIEKGRHPRFAIGESSTPLANLLWEDLCQRYDLPNLSPLAKWGSWQKAHPQIGCGLKRGFSFFYHRAGERHDPNPRRDNQLLVAASASDEVADTHWYRPDFDHFMVRQAQHAGVDFVDDTTLEHVEFTTRGVALKGQQGGGAIEIRAGFVVDASGTRGFLQRALRLPELPFEWLPPTQTLFTHFRDVRSLESLGFTARDEAPPYPIGAAAVHHVFDGGWVWVLRFNNGLTSAGVAAQDELALDLGLAAGVPGWSALLQRFPSLADQFADARIVRPFEHRTRLSFRTDPLTGERWALLPSAAGFIDPLLSTGFTLTLLGVARVAGIFERNLRGNELARAWQIYEQQSRAELLATEQLVAGLYASMSRFELFARLALLYFAAVSYAEIKGRKGERSLQAPFLLQDMPSFWTAVKGCCRDAVRLRQTNRQRDLELDLAERVLETIAPVDLIGLSDLRHRNWYPSLSAQES